MSRAPRRATLRRLAGARGRGRDRGPRRSSTAGSCRRPRAGRSTTSPAATGRSIAQVAEGGAEDVDRAVAAARASFDDRRWADQSPGQPQARPAQARRADPRATATSSRCSSRSTSASRSATRSRSTSRRRPRRSSGTPRRSTRSTARSGRPAGRAVARHPRADRRRGGDRALELPADHHRLEARARPWRPATRSSSSRRRSRR